MSATADMRRPGDSSATGPAPGSRGASQLRRLLAAARVVPVLTIEDAGEAVPLVTALAAGGLSTVEIVLRTPGALDAIRTVSRELPEVVVGAGSVTSPERLAAAHRAGARFTVSPGFTAELAEAARRAEIPWLPGVATVSEAMVARGHGFDVLKLFPATALGGPAFLDAVRGPLPDLSFCPTGGIDGATWRAYLARENTVAVGGSWMICRHAVATGDWNRVTRAARELAP